MDISTVAFLIPIHPPKYHFIYNLIRKLTENCIRIDVFLVFSSIDEYDVFTMKSDIQYFILPHPFQTNSIVTFKKFYGLQKLMDSKYEYFICCDSEIDIIPEYFIQENILNKITQIFHNKKIYAGDTKGQWVSIVTRTSANLFKEKKHSDALQILTQNYTLYFWWSDLPVYRANDLKSFFQMIRYDAIVSEHFDYMIYQYYLLLQFNFEIINTTPITKLTWSLENLYDQTQDELNQLVSLGYGYSWVTKRMYDRHTDFVHSQKGFLVYHLDRMV